MWRIPCAACNRHALHPCSPYIHTAMHLSGLRHYRGVWVAPVINAVCRKKYTRAVQQTHCTFGILCPEDCTTRGCAVGTAYALQLGGLLIETYILSHIAVVRTHAHLVYIYREKHNLTLEKPTKSKHEQYATNSLHLELFRSCGELTRCGLLLVSTSNPRISPYY